MVTPKIKVITTRSSQLEVDIQAFLNTLDVHQIVDIGFVSNSGSYNDITCSIIYIELKDVRDMKISTLLDNKI